jgi:hypothetical protein
VSGREWGGHARWPPASSLSAAAGEEAEQREDDDDDDDPDNDAEDAPPLGTHFSAQLFRRCNPAGETQKDVSWRPAHGSRIAGGAKQHGVEQLLPFHCECAAESCVAKIELAPADYDRIASHIGRFVVIPGHELPPVELIVERRPGYLVVEKTGEARGEIEREHPRPRHRD